MVNVIRFSEHYTKMPARADPSTLVQVFTVNRAGLKDVFVEYDTAIVGGGNYELVDDKVLVLLFLTKDNELWTTIRSNTPKHFHKYMPAVGEQFVIEVK